MNKSQHQERRWPTSAQGRNGAAVIGAVSGPAAVAAAAARARPARVMPTWVTASGRSSAAPPPPPGRPEPDYEVIEFPNDQYVNAKLNPPPKHNVNQHCGLCGAPGARMRCLECDGRALCISCDDMYHRHPKRRAHRRQPIAVTDDSDRPPLPPKGANPLAPPPPVPPPRRNKVVGRSDSFSSRGSRTPQPPGALVSPAVRRPLPATPSLPSSPHQIQTQQCTAAPTNGSGTINGWNRPSTAASPASPRLLQHTQEPHAWSGGGGCWSATMDPRRRSTAEPAPADGNMRRAAHASSVFDLHRPDAYPPQHPMMQQQRFLPAQSMATLSCANCAGCQHQRAAAGEFWRYGSNASLDARSHEGFGHPGMWVNPWLPPVPHMYPHTHRAAGRPSSRAHSRVASRAASPAASVRSRRSRHGHRYHDPDGYSDDEDSSDERPRRRDSVRSQRATPSPVPHMDRDQSRRVGRRDSSSSHNRHDSPARILPRESPVRAIRASPARENERPIQTRELRGVETMGIQPRQQRVPLSPVKSIRESPLRSTEEQFQETAEPETDVLDAPPPAVPTARWQCEYCTYVNEAGVRVCEICCRTPMAPPRLASVGRSTPAPSEHLEGLTLTERSRVTPETSRTSVETEPPKKGDDETTRIDEQVEKLENVQPREKPDHTSSDVRAVISLGVKRVKKTNSEKVSTGCGPSPPRQSPPAPASEPVISESPATPGTASTGTSPLPQSISTQTYGNREEILQSAASSGRPTSSTADESSRSTRRRSARALRRDARRSRHTPEPDHISRSERSHSRHSFSSDARSIGTPAREWSPAAAPEEEWWCQTGPLRSRSNSLLHNQRPRSSIPRRLPPRRASHLDLHRERDDPRWRRPVFGDPYAYSDLRDISGVQPDVTRAISLETLAAARRHTDVVRSQGLELVKLLREAEASGFTAEELHAATQQCGATEPVRWLQENWDGMVSSVQTVASKLGREAGAGDTVGTLSEREARDALRRHKGSIWQAVTECVQQRQRKYGELMSRGKFSREEVLTCLTAHHGDLEAAYLDLTKNQLKPFLVKIWGPSEGVENDSANPSRPGTSGVAPTVIDLTLGNNTAEDENVTYLNKLKKFETIMNRDANKHPDNSVSGNNNQFTEKDLQVPHQATAVVQETVETNRATADILGGLKSLLIRAGIPVSEQALLSGLKNIMNIKEDKTKALTEYVQTSDITIDDTKKDVEIIIDSTNNNLIHANNAMTSGNPPNVEPNLSVVINKSQRQNTARDAMTTKICNLNYQPINNSQEENKVEDAVTTNFNHHSIDQPSGSITISNNDYNLGTINRTIASYEHIQTQNVRKNRSPDVNSIEMPTQSSQSKDDQNYEERSLHLSDIVNDTHRLVQQMKDEINSDMAAYDGDGRNSEYENESSITPDTSEHDSYIDGIRSSSSSEYEAEEVVSEEFTEESDNKGDINQKQISKSLPQSSTSDDNDQFEEAIDNSENLNFEQSNMATLDAIVKSLQELDYNIDVTASSLERGDNSQHINREQTIVSSGNDNIVNNAAITRTVHQPTNIDEAVVGFSMNDNRSEERYEFALKPHSTGDKENYVSSGVLTLDANDTATYSDVTRNVTGEIVEENIEDYNNNTLAVKSFEELYESLSLNQSNNNVQIGSVANNRSSTPEVIITDRPLSNIHSTADIIIEGTFNERPERIPSNITTDSRPELAQAYQLDSPETIITPKICKEESNSTKEISNKAPMIRSISHESGKSINAIERKFSKSNIPKPRSGNNNGPSKSDLKQPTKIITSKVPIRRNSLKQQWTTSQKLHFGNVQSGHVKNLQSSLFGNSDNKTFKIPVPITKKFPAKFGLALVKPMPSKIITIQSDNSTNKANLKPYFRETCLSDEYLTETDDEAGKRARSPKTEFESAPQPTLEPKPEPIPVTSRMVKGQLVDFTQVSLKDGSPERQVRMLVAEGVVETWQQAEVAMELAARGETPAAALLAAHDCTDLPSAVAYLNQECELCAGHVPAYEIVSMLACSHRCCSDCARNYFTVQITERSIFDCVCPFCKLPELAAATAPPGSDEHEDEALEYFSRLEHLLKSVVETGVHELFQRKLRDRALLQDPNFKWCIECSSGFFVHPRQKRVKCPECRTVTCARCRKPWEKQHEGQSCEEFSQWKQSNDPETSIQAVQRHLQDNGIDCPKCKFRYSLSRGGCMHFTCSQCKYEFCCGCGKPFTMGARCGLSDYCAKLGLHAHHPRNCLFYLRDKEPHQLQTLLQMHSIEYKTEPADASDDTTATGELAGNEKRPRRCPVALQRETPAGLVDATCNSDVPPHHAGLCKTHYLEYLAGVVMANAVDSLPIMDLSDVVAELRRRALPLPERGPWDSDPIYAGMCSEIVKEKIPLE